MAAGLALIFFFRAPLLEGLIAGQLEALGAPDPRLRVSQASLDALTIEEFKLGSADEATVERIEVLFDVFGETPGGIQRIRVERPVLRVDLKGDQPPLGSLQGLLGGESEGGPPPALPEIEVVDGRVFLDTVAGPVAVDVGGLAQSAPDGAIKAALSYRAVGDPGRLRGGLSTALAPDGAINGRLGIDDGAIALASPGGGVAGEIGGLTGALDFQLRDGRPESVTGRLALTDLGLIQARFRDAALDFALTEERVEASGKLRARDDGVQAAFRAEVLEPLGRAAFGLGLSLAATAEAELFKLVAQPFSRGQATATLTASGALGALTDQTSESGPLERLLGGLIEGTFSVELADLAVPERLSGLSLAAQGELLLADGAAAVTLAPGAAGEVQAIDQDWLTPFGLPPALAARLAEGLRFALEPAEPLPAGAQVRPLQAATEVALDGRLVASTRDEAGPRLALELRQALATLGDNLAIFEVPDLRLAAADLPLPGLASSEATVVGSLYGQADELESELLLRARAPTLRQGDLRLEDLSLTLPVELTYLGGALEAWVTRPGEVRLAGLSHASGLRLVKPARLGIEEGTLLASPPSEEGTGGDRFAHDLRLRLGRLALAYEGDGAAALPIELRPARLKLIGEREGKGRYRGRLQLSGGGAALPSLETKLDRLSARVDFDAGFDAPSLRLNTDLAYRALPPFRLDGTARKRGQSVSFEAELGASEGPLAEQGLRPQLSGDYNLANGRAGFTLAPLRLSFAPGLLQPGDLSPDLTLLQRVTGTLAAEATGSWADGKLAGRGALQVRGLGFKREEVTVQGLDLDLALDGLWPPRSPPGQRLRIARVDSAVPVEGIDATFRLLPGDPVKAEIAQLGFTSSGSQFGLRQALLDPAAERHRLRLDLASFDLQGLFSMLDVEGLSGSGKLSGSLPVSLSGETVVITDGRLESLGPGVLSYRRKSGPAPAAGVPSAEPEEDEEEDPVALFQDPLELTLRALENFHYDRLAIGVDKKAGGEAALRIQLQGKNPDLLDGYPFNLNINLTGDVTPVVEALSRGIDLTQELFSRSWRLQP